VDVEGLLELIHEELALLLLLQEFLLQQVDLPLQVRQARSFILRHNQFSFKICDLFVDAHDILNLLLVVDFTFLEGALLDLDFFIEE